MEFNEIAPKPQAYDNNYTTDFKLDFKYGSISLSLHHEVEELD
jgi:hypothetical protein